ncbi:nuclear transport factor 2 family protein [Rudaea sp.]|uniref:ester cyclase n=1 Tax=Rudaea sp. TaxID=2136325 RepID=UPI003220947D
MPTLALRPFVEPGFILLRSEFEPSPFLAVCTESCGMKTATRIFLFCLASGIANTATPAGACGDTQSMDLVRLKFAAFNKHDADAIEKIYARDATLHSPDYPDLAGNKPIADTYRRLFDAVPDAEDKLETLENSSNRVYARFVLTGHLQGAQDKPINVRIISVYTVKDGHIVDDSTYYDRKMP